MLEDVALHEQLEVVRFKLEDVTLLDTQLQLYLEVFPEVTLAQEQDPLVALVEQLMDAMVNRSLEAQQLHTLADDVVGSQ